MLAFETIAERRIAEAVAHGEFDGLPGAGRPLEFDDDSMVPLELRMAHRILKNAGFLPDEGGPSGHGPRRLELMRARIDARYFGRVIGKLGRNRGNVAP